MLHVTERSCYAPVAPRP